MALDGFLLHCLKTEIEEKALETRIEKVHQPTREELILHLRGRGGALKLLMTAKADAPRIHFTQFAPENPAAPPMFCMLLRKHLTGARLIAVRQNALERVLFLDFEATNELGDKVYPKLIIEIMARHSNIILVNDENRIIDAVKRVDFTKSSVREILPGLLYELPPAQDKENLLQEDLTRITQKILAGDKRLSKAVQGVLQGVSPVICREVAYRSAGDDIAAAEVPPDKLRIALSQLKQDMLKPVPTMLMDVDQKPFDYTFCSLTQYQGCGTESRFPTFSQLLDQYFYQRERTDRIRQRSQDLFKQLNVLQERAVRKAAAQKEQLKDCAKKTQLKVYGDLISANLYCLEKGSAFYDLQNFYEDALPTVRIAADPSLTPNQNAQKYYKEYRKLQTAESMLWDLIAKSEQEGDYLESVLEALSRADTDRELAEIKEELYEGGYLKHRKGKQRRSKPLPPMEFVSKDGYAILVGRNNVQNDKLTLRDSKNYDLWLHTKEIPGSHVVIPADRGEPTEQAVYDAAMLAAFFSKGRESANVPVDYTLIKNVKKPQGAKPGRVIYETYRTVYVTPNEAYLKELTESEGK